MTCRSFRKYEVSREGVVRERKTKKILPVRREKRLYGYVDYVIIDQGDVIRKRKVAEMFAGTYIEHPKDCHDLICLNGNWNDFKEDNFRWVNKRKEITKNDTKMWRTIKAFPRYEISEDGEVRNKAKGNILRTVDRGKSLYVKLPHKVRKNNEMVTAVSSRAIHNLVAEAFLEKSNKKVSHHKDGNYKNNHYTNLEWGLYPANAETPIQKKSLPIDEYDLEGNLVREWRSIVAAVKSLGLTYKGVVSCCRGYSKSSGNRVWRFHGDAFDKYETPEEFHELKGEVFKQIEGSDYNYVSNFGRVICKFRCIKVIKPNKMNNVRVKINGRATYRYLPKLVATHFLENPNCYNNIKTIDGNENNCRVENLMWVKERNIR